MIPTKTLIPRRSPHLLHRPRLVDRLHRYVDRALTLVSAPAGYGKTSLLIDFAHDAPFPVCWLSLDASDRDLYTFVEYLVAALRHRFPQFGGATLRALTGNSGLGRNPLPLVGVLVHDMLDNVPEFFALILDDYHTVDDSREINQLLTPLLTYRPDHCHLIFASRTAPAGLPIIQLTARSQVAGVGPAHLAFTAEEIQALLAQAHDIHLSSAQAEELAAESEGWIIGILLSTEAMWQGMRDLLARANLRHAQDAGTREGPIYTYLAEQVFVEQPPDLCDFLLASSTLEEMNETRCREALGLASVACTMREIERRGVFVTTVADETTGTWYRYHHLLRNFLQTRLQTQDPARFRQLHQRAADWFEADEQWESAVAHRLIAGDARAAAQTMDAAVSSLFYAGRMATLVAWHEALPEPLRPEFPRLPFFAGRALVAFGRLDEAMPLLSQAEAIFTEEGETERALLAALDRANIWYGRGRPADALALVQEVLVKAADHPTPAAEAHRLAGTSCLNLGRPEEALDHLYTSLALYRELGWAHEAALAYLDLALALLRVGQRSEAWACQDKAIELYRQSGPSDLLAVALNDVACGRYYLTGDYAPALTYLHEALAVARAAGAPRAQALALLTTADLYRDLGALEQATAFYARAEEIARQVGDAAFVNFATTGLAQARLMAGETLEALGLAAQARDQAERRGDVYQFGLSCLTLGAAHLDAGDPATALAEIERGRDLLMQSGARPDLTRAYVLLARAREATGDGEAALAALGQALDVGIKTQSFHYLVVEGQRAFGLLRQALKRNPADRRPAEIMDRIRALPDVAREIVGGLAPAALPHPPALRFYGFGPGRVAKDGETLPLSAWGSALARHLVFYSLVHPPRSRDQIAATFWPDASPDRAKATFHAVKCQAHRALGRSLIVYEDGRYRVEPEPDCWFDVAAFESLLEGHEGRQARLEEAVSLYRGDFLEGYDVAWSQPIRERLRLRFRDALIELGESYTAQRRFDRAFATLSRAVAIDDLHEPASRALMRLYALDGRSHAALDHFRQLQERLQELGTAPAPETQALYQEIQAGTIDRQP
jgi:LuxR family maltose regulon positive regulatory protein